MASIAYLMYTNHRGETALRKVIPLRVWYGSTKWHPDAQWFMSAKDVDRNVQRDFALRDCDFRSAGLFADEQTEGAPV